MSLARDEVRKIAFLARIKVADERLDSLAGELNAILGWIEQLNEVDTDGVRPMASVSDVTLPEREDAVTAGAEPERVLANAPERRNGFFAVPKVIE